MPFCKNCGYELPEGATYCPRCGTPVTIREESVAAGAPYQPSTRLGLQLAFWWERVIAWLIDVAIIQVIIGILGLFALIWSVAFNPTITPGWPDWITFFISFNLTGLLRFLYWTFMEGSNGQSFGKMVMRIKTVHVDGRRLSVGNAAVESAGKAFFLPLDLLIGWILYPKKRQRIFNYLSQTVVVKAS